jgi:hypothetical protein
MPPSKVDMNQLKFRAFVIFMFVLILHAFLATPALGQAEDELRLNIRKSFGYSSGFGSGNLKLQGIMVLTASGPQNVQRVVFYLDETTLGEVTQAPFSLRFSTDSYPLGVHTLVAVGTTAQGGELRSNEVKAEFVTAQAGWQDAMRIVGPLLGLVFAVMVVAFLIPVLMSRGKKSSTPLGAERVYGALGGTICPKCKRPFPMHLFGLNMLTHKLDLCPHCRRWSFVRRLPLDQLRAAEQAELEMAQGEPQVSTLTEEEKLKKELEDSRYDRT